MASSSTELKKPHSPLLDRDKIKPITPASYEELEKKCREFLSTIDLPQLAQEFREKKSPKEWRWLLNFSKPFNFKYAQDFKIKGHEAYKIAMEKQLDLICSNKSPALSLSAEDLALLGMFCDATHPHLAKKFYELAVEKGSTHAEYALGLLILLQWFPDTHRKAIELIKSAMLKGLPEAKATLASMFLFSYKAERSSQQARYFSEEAVKDDCAKGFFVLGFTYLKEENYNAFVQCLEQGYLRGAFLGKTELYHLAELHHRWAGHHLLEQWGLQRDAQLAVESLQKETKNLQASNSFFQPASLNPKDHIYDSEKMERLYRTKLGSPPSAKNKLD